MANTPSLDMIMLDSSGNQIYSLKFQASNGTPTDAVTLRLKNNESSQGTSVNLLFAIRADLLRAAPSFESTLESNSNGQELMTESWLEVKAGADPWTPIDEWSSGGYDLGAIAAGAYAEFQARLNVAADAETLGECNFAVVVRSRP